MNSDVSMMTGARLLDACPDCGGRDLLVEEVAGQVVFRCLACTSGWRHVLGYLLRVPHPDNETGAPSDRIQRVAGTP